MSATSLNGVFYDGCELEGSAATMMLAGRTVVLVGTKVSARFSSSEIRVSPRTGTSSRFLELPDGGQFQCADNPALDGLRQEGRSEGIVAWLEQQWPVAAASVVLIMSVLAWGYWFGLPVAAERIAQRVPIQTERALGEQALTWLDGNQWLNPSKLDTQKQHRLVAGFSKLIEGLPAEEYYALAFRSAPQIGANALALPGGTIVLTDDMVHAGNSDEDVLAVLAHEIGHVEKRHTLRLLLHDSAIAVVATMLTADAASLGVAVAGLPALLTRLEFSREFESEADEYAFTLLSRHDISPEHFAIIMERVAASAGSGKEQDESAEIAFLSTHPLTEQRVARAREAAAGSGFAPLEKR